VSVATRTKTTGRDGAYKLPRRPRQTAPQQQQSQEPPDNQTSQDTQERETNPNQRERHREKKPNAEKREKISLISNIIKLYLTNTILLKNIY